MRACLLILVATLCLGFAPAPFPRRERHNTSGNDQANLQGKWVRTRCVISGNVYNERAGGTTITITGNRLQFPVASDTWLFTIDPSRRPKRFDYRGNSPSVKSIVYRGVYRLEGDTLTICAQRNGTESDRAQDFTATKAGRLLQVFRRLSR